MTAEIAIMNRHAVALAADSAVTVELTRGQKIYNTVNKLFMLSKHAPVGLMVFGHAQITGVPWETVVKEYRRELGDTKFSTTQQYAEGLLAYLESKVSLFPRDQQAHELQMHGMSLYGMVLDEIQTEIHRLLAANGEVRDGQIRRIVTDRIRSNLSDIEAATDLPGFPPEFCEQLENEFRAELNECIDIVFEKLPVGTAGRARLRQLVCRFMVKDVFPSAMSGVVVAGFGEDEHFPSLHQFHVQSVLMGRVKAKEEGTRTAVTEATTATIFPFAQREMVNLFMEGVDPRYRRAIEVAIDGFLNGLPDVLVAGLAIPDAQKTTLMRRMASAGRDILRGFQEELARYSFENHIAPIVNAVAVLPKEELAEMAESLVNLTSFKRRVTMDPETVGGPIDVAVISKGDGFIWIKRKHYFDPEKNHHFFSNYFK